MNILDFTVEEINIVAMYKTDTRKGTRARIGYAMPYMSQEMRGIAQSASRKLLMLSELEFLGMSFVAADDSGEV